MKKKTTYLAALTLTLVLSASMGSALAYFTTNASARGGYQLRLGNHTTIIEEQPTDWTKHVTVANSAESGPVYVRVRAFSGSQYPLTYLGEGWTPGTDGYYYYDEIVQPGDSTGNLDIHIGGVPEDVDEEMELNVAVIYESTPVQYDENGDPYPDWSITLDSGDAEGGAEG